MGRYHLWFWSWIAKSKKEPWNNLCSGRPYNKLNLFHSCKDEYKSATICTSLYSEYSKIAMRTYVYCIKQRSHVYFKSVEGISGCYGHRIDIYMTYHPQTNGQLERTIHVLNICWDLVYLIGKVVGKIRYH